jgi:hypothetical protein
MLIRKLALLAVLCALATASSASAATYLHSGTTTGNVLPSGTSIKGTLKSATTATLTISSGTVTCTSAEFNATVDGSGGATVLGMVTALKLGPAPGGSGGTCSDTIASFDFDYCEDYLAPGTSFYLVAQALSPAGGGLQFQNAYLRCHVAGSSPAAYCYYYGAPINGNYANAGFTLSFASASVAHQVPAGVTNDAGASCTSSATLTVAFAPVTNSVGTGIFMNQTA